MHAAVHRPQTSAGDEHAVSAAVRDLIVLDLHIAGLMTDGIVHVDSVGGAVLDCVLRNEDMLAVIDPYGGLLANRPMIVRPHGVSRDLNVVGAIFHMDSRTPGHA